MSGWYVYEDFVTHEAVVHRGDCVHCNYGQGHGAGRNERENTWHGEFSSEQLARAARIDPRSYLRNCRVCIGSQHAPRQTADNAARPRRLSALACRILRRDHAGEAASRPRALATVRGYL